MVVGLLQKFKGSKKLSFLYYTYYNFDKVKMTKARMEFISNMAFFHHMCYNSTVS